MTTEEHQKLEEKKAEVSANLALLILVVSQAGSRPLTSQAAFSVAEEFVNEATKRKVDPRNLRGVG